MNTPKMISRFCVAALLSGSMAGVSTMAVATEQPTDPILSTRAETIANFGGPDGVRAWVESLFYYIMLDRRIAHVFREFGNVERQTFLNTQLAQLVLNGPVEYQGASMSAAHADLGITMTEFNAVVEAAYNACDRNLIKYHDCNQLINALAPFTDDIVTR
ncbi:MAG: group I truncated hemoglobin [Panacagrimonas sp.]